MADLISRKALVTKLSKGYWNRELQQAKNDPCVIDAMIDWAIRIVKEMPLESPWHTGTPIKIGFYLVTTAIENYHVRFFNGVRFCNHPKSLKILAWQKIEPYKEDWDG